MTNAHVDGERSRGRPGWLPGRWEQVLLAASVILAFGIGSAIKIVVGGEAPLWMDEAVTGVIAVQPNVHAMVARALSDPGAPLYYAFMYGWAGVAGDSNAALRFPSVVFAITAPLIVLVPNPAVRRDKRLLWCALLALWWPGLRFAQEARCYAMLLFLATATTVAYMRLLVLPGIGRATIWAVLGALTILTHYYAAVLIGIQGLAYAAVHGRRAVRTWPALLAFVPVLGWIKLHSETLIRFADPSFTWYQLIDHRHLPSVAEFLFGMPVLAVWAVLVGLGALAAGLRTGSGRRDALSPATVVVGTAVTAVIIVLVVGALRPSVTIRYLIPCAPGILLGVALAADVMNRRLAASGIVFVVLFGIAAVNWVREGGVPAYKQELEIESASRAMIDAKVERVAFVWDNPLFDAMDPGFARELGGFFFHRAGVAVGVEAFQRDRLNMLEASLSADASGARTGLLWVHEPDLPRPTAMQYPPAALSDPAWRCTKTGRGSAGAIGCVRP